MRLVAPSFLLLALCASAPGQDYTIRTLAGSTDVFGSVAVDSDGNIYFATDAGNAVSRVDAATGQLTRFAGTGKAGYSGDRGPALRAQLHMVGGLAADAAGNVYIADSQNRRIRKVSNGEITTFAGDGSDGNSGDNGPATGAQLGALAGVAVDASGNVYIADNLYNVIRKVSNGFITTIAGNGTKIQGSLPVDHSDDDGPAIGARLYLPAGVAVDAAGRVYIADAGNHVIRVLCHCSR
jgi:DNA-binding beta-propeller fold protein YncE